jgi:hypothetical protein
MVRDDRATETGLFERVEEAGIDHALAQGPQVGVPASGFFGPEEVFTPERAEARRTFSVRGSRAM